MSAYYSRSGVWLLAGALIAFCIPQANAQMPRNPKEAPPKLSGVKNDVASLTTYNKRMQAAPLLFTENRGQVTSSKGRLRTDILFTAHSAGASIYLTATGIYYQFNRTIFPEGYEPDEREAKDHVKQAELREQIKTETHRFTVLLEGANPAPIIRKEQQNSYIENFYLAHCPGGITGVNTYERAVMENVYPGIDWVVYSKGQHMKYDFVVHPGADPSVIKLKVSDADAVNVTEDGALLMKTSLGEVREAQPISICGNVKVQSSFMKAADGTFSFRLADWDKSRTLVIDPSVSWGTYYGGSGEDVGYYCATDGSGNVYLAGSTTTSGGTAIATSGSHQEGYGGGMYDAFLVKFNSGGVRQWGTYYGGSEFDGGGSCTTDGLGNVYLTGITQTTGGTAIATSGSHQASFGGGSDDAFLVKFNSNGVRQWGTYYGGSGYEYGRFCTTDGSGNVYVTGTTSGSVGTAVATAGSHQASFGGFNYDAFLVKFNSGGVRQWGTYYGGDGEDHAHSCATDGLGNIYLAGQTRTFSGTSIATASSHQPAHGCCSFDAFLVKFNSSGNRQWGTYYGGTEEDYGFSCATDGTGNVYLAGSTNGSGGTSIATPGSHQASFGGSNWDGFLAKFNSGGVRQWGSYYGGNGDDWGYSCVTDGTGNVYLTGRTSTFTGTAIATPGSHQAGYGGGSDDAFLVQFNSGGTRQWGTYYGGGGYEISYSCATDGPGNVYIAGHTNTSSGTTIATPGSHQASYGGGSFDAFLVKFGSATPPSITCPADKTINCDESTAPSNTGTATASSGCGSTSITFSDVTTPGSCAGNSTITRTWTATDDCNNSSTCTQTINVVDNTAPTITCPPAATVACDGDNSPATTGTATAQDNCSGATITYTDGPTIPGNCAGNYSFVRIWKATDGCGNSSTCNQNINVVDTKGPNAVCKNATVTLSNGSASITPGDIDNGSTDNCSGIASYSLDKSTFSCDDIGNNMVTLTVTDNCGNSSTCTATVTVVGQIPSCTVNSTPTSGTYTDGSPNHIYFGYGDGKTELSVTPSGGSSNYSWTGPNLSCYNCPDPTFTATAGGNYTFTVTVTNANGCTATCSITICVLDIRVPGQMGKVYICHVPQGDPSNAHTLSVGTSAVASHLNNHSGDKLGQCSQVCSSGAIMTAGNSHVIGAEVKVYPNPNNGTFIIELPYIEVNSIISVTDVAGKTIYNRVVKDGNRLNLQLGDVAKGMYFVEVTIGNQRFRTKLMIQ